MDSHVCKTRAAVLLVNYDDSFFHVAKDMFVPCAEQLCFNVGKTNPSVKDVDHGLTLQGQNCVPYSKPHFLLICLHKKLRNGKSDVNLSN